MRHAFSFMLLYLCSYVLLSSYVLLNPYTVCIDIVTINGGIGGHGSSGSIGNRIKVVPFSVELLPASCHCTVAAKCILYQEAPSVIIF